MAVPTIFGITVLIFVAMRVLPGDPLAVIASEGQGQYRLTDDELAAARASLGLDRPLPQQYLTWMADVARGDLGRYACVDRIEIVDVLPRTSVGKIDKKLLRARFAGMRAPEAIG